MDKDSSARIKEPFSITWAPGQAGGQAALYVADSANHAIRRLSLSGAVTTVWGGPGVQSKINAANISQYDQVGGCTGTCKRLSEQLKDIAACFVKENWNKMWNECGGKCE